MKKRSQSLSNESLWLKGAVGSLFLLSLIIVSVRIFAAANTLPFFVDETADNAVAAFNFFQELNYYSVRFPEHFDPRISSGILSTWPAGLVWSVGGSLFQQRLLFSFLQMAFLFLLVWNASSLLKLNKETSLVLFSCIALLIFRLPYWEGFLRGLAELQGALWVGLALLLFFQNKSVLPVGLSFGIAVFFCKFIYFPAVGLMMAAIAYSQSVNWSHRFIYFSKLFGAFLIPFLSWLLVIWLKTDSAYVMAWLNNFVNFVLFSGHSVSANLGLSERLSTLEWASYSTFHKLRILVLLFLPAFGTWTVFTEKRSQMLGLSIVLSLFFYAFWWFFLHPHMYARHLQPALFLSFAYLVLVFIALIRRWFAPEKSHKLLVCGGGAFLSLLVLVELKSLPRYFNEIQSKDTYSSQCRGQLMSQTCLKEYFGQTP